MSTMSAVVTTKNRLPILKQCLDRLFASASKYNAIHDVVVVNDGSSDDTEQYLRELSRQRPIKYFTNQISRGPSAARNLGVKHASGDFVLIMGDDVLVDEDMTGVLHQHVNNQDMSAASVIGNIQPWPQGMTPFEFWLSNGGSQFTHYRIQKRDAFDAGENYFYTTNIVTARSLLLNFPFDESFPYARYEDRELGYRLKREIGHKIHYRKEALSYHLHKLPFKEWLLKFEKFSWAAVHFSNLYPHDKQLHLELGRTQAELLHSFRYPIMMEAVNTINRHNDVFFLEEKVYGSEWIREVVGRGFRTLQDFFRMNYYRKHLNLPQLYDQEHRISAAEAMQTILGQLKNGL